MRAILEGETILLVEGEKDADRATAELGLIGTTCPMGAESWRAAYTKMLHDARVVLIPDNDRAGRQHMDNVGRDLLGVAKSVKRVDLPNLPDKGDLSDWIDAGGNREALLSIIEQTPEFEGHPNPHSLSGGGCGGRFKWFGQMGQPKPQEFLADPAAPKAFPLVVHGAGGSAKSYLMVLLAMIHASPAGGSWLGSSVKGGGRALVVDFELNEDVFNYRVRRLAKGVGIDPSTISGLAYYEVGDQGTKEAFDEVYRLCREHNFDLVIIDSVGPALEGDASSSRDVIQFHRNRISSLTALGVTPALIDHQARAYSDEDYQVRGAFGSGYKEHLAHSVLQVHPRPPDTNSDTLVVRMRHKKATFTKLMKPFDVWLTFSEESVRVERHDVDDDSLLKEQAISLESRILGALRLHEKGAVSDLTDWLGANRGSVDNAVRLLRKQGRIIEVGKEGNATVYSLPEETSTSTPPKEYGGGGLKSVPKFLTDQDQVGDLAEHATGAVHVALDLEGDLDAKVNRLHRESGIRVLSVHLAGETHLLDLRAVDPTPLLKVLEDIPIYVHGAEFDIAALHHRYGLAPLWHF